LTVMISNWVRKLMSETEPSEPHMAEANGIFRALGGNCPKCGNTLRDHSYQLFATTVADEHSETLMDFIRCAKRHEWETLSHFQTFDPLKNALEVYSLRCPDSSLSLLIVRDPFELFDGMSVEDSEGLDQEESTRWSSFLPAHKWKSLGKGASAG
jgi:hypothetical protein